MRAAQCIRIAKRCHPRAFTAVASLEDPSRLTEMKFIWLRYSAMQIVLKFQRERDNCRPLLISRGKYSGVFCLLLLVKGNLYRLARHLHYATDVAGSGVTGREYRRPRDRMRAWLVL